MLIGLIAGHSLLPFVKHCAEEYLRSEEKEVRKEAVWTCSHLLVSAMASASKNHHNESPTLLLTVSNVLSSLLNVAITDPGKLF